MTLDGYNGSCDFVRVFLWALCSCSDFTFVLFSLPNFSRWVLCYHREASLLYVIASFFGKRHRRQRADNVEHPTEAASRLQLRGRVGSCGTGLFAWEIVSHFPRTEAVLGGCISRLPL